MYRATLIFSYSFSLSGYYTYFWYPIPLSQLCLGYFLSFRPPYPSCRCARVFPALFGLYTLFPAAPWVFPALFGLYTLFPAAPWYFLHFSASIPFFPLRPGISCTFRPLYPFSRCALGISCTFRPLYPFSRCALVFPSLSGSLYPCNTEILCMLFSYNTQNSIGKRFPQPFL